MTLPAFLLVGCALLFLFYAGVIAGYLKGRRAGYKKGWDEARKPPPSVGFRPGDHRQWKRGLGNPEENR